jgi:uncharacterized protein
MINNETMSNRRIYQTFTHREAVFRICCDSYDAVITKIVQQRKILEDYIEQHPEFQQALEPIDPNPDAPEVAWRMARAAQKVGVGPMAAVAGVMAQCAAEAGLQAGDREVIVENGGDIYLKTVDPIIIGLYSGATELADKLAFSMQPDDTPIAICSSSGKMGHSMSLGQCDLATVVAKDAALADAAATLAANLVHIVEDVDAALQRIAAIKGVDGVLIIHNDRVGLAGQLPPLQKVKER